MANETPFVFLMGYDLLSGEVAPERGRGVGVQTDASNCYLHGI